MSELLLGPLLRYQDSSSATVWVEVSAPAVVGVLGTTTRTFTVCGRHYALVIIEGLEPDTVYEYQVRLDGGGRVAGARLGLPAERDSHRAARAESRRQDDRRIVSGSGAPRAAVHTRAHVRPRRPWHRHALGAHRTDEARPVDTWPDLALLNGDQVYADDSSPRPRSASSNSAPMAATSLPRSWRTSRSTAGSTASPGRWRASAGSCRPCRRR